MTNDKISLTECPRDAMQGIREFIPTPNKIEYLNLLLKCGFDVLDFGSFVSPKAIPQLSDTREVLAGLDLNSKTRLLAIVANERGANDAASYEEITFLGYPFSVSPTFQLRNTNSNMHESLELIKSMLEISERHNKTLLIYLSMAFGNPYGDEYSPQVVIDWAGKLNDLGVRNMALADTVGSSNKDLIQQLIPAVIGALPQVELSAHLHTTPSTWQEKLEAAWDSGCRKFDGAVRGYGGCPMASDELTGNMPTEKMLEFAEMRGIQSGIDKELFSQAMNYSGKIFQG